MSHPERLENTLPGELRQSLSRNPLHDLGEQEEARVAVEVLVSGLEVQRFLPDDGVERVLAGGHVLPVDPTEIEELQVITQAAGVLHQVPDGDRGPVPGNLGNVLPHLVVDVELSVLLQEKNGEHRELLRGGADVEDRGGGDRDPELQVRHPVPAGVVDRPLAEDAQGAARRIRSLVVREDRVHSRPSVAIGRMAKRRCDGRESQSPGDDFESHEPPRFARNDRC